MAGLVNEKVSMSKNQIIPEDYLDESEYRPIFKNSPFIHIADLVNKETGKTYREENAEKVHDIPIGALVEILPDEYGDIRNDGVRLFVVYHARDCDQTPLYCLSPHSDDTELEDTRFYNRGWVSGYSEDSLEVIRLPK
jgi:hypothetical protein